MKEKFDGLVDHLIGANIFLEQAIEILEKAMIQRALQDKGGNQCAASKVLGIHRNTLQRKMVAYGLVNGRGRGKRKPAGRESRTRGRGSRARLA